MLHLMAIVSLASLTSACALGGPGLVNERDFPFEVTFEEQEEELDYARVMANSFDQCGEALVYGGLLESGAEVTESVRVKGELDSGAIFTMSQTIMRTGSPEEAAALADGFATVDGCPQPETTTEGSTTNRVAVGMGIRSPGASYLTTLNGELLDSRYSFQYIHSIYAADEYLIYTTGRTEPVGGYDYQFLLELVEANLN